MSDGDQESRLSTLNEIEELDYHLSENEEDKKEYKTLTRRRELDLSHPYEKNENVSFDSRNSQGSIENQEVYLIAAKTMPMNSSF